MGLSKEGNFIASTLIELYGNIGMIGKAQTVLDKLETRDEIILTSLLTGYLKHGYYEEAFECVKQIQLMGVTLDSSLFICVLKACGSLKARDTGEEIHADIEKKGWLGHKQVGNALIEMYVKCGSVVVAQHVFDKLKVKDVVSWNTLISGYVEDGCGTKSLNYFELMQEQRVLPNTTTFIHALQSCGMARNLDKGCEIHSQIEKMGLPETDLVNLVGFAKRIKYSTNYQIPIPFLGLPLLRDILSMEIVRKH
jgi:pentatricopeptide repeat protein